MPGVVRGNEIFPAKYLSAQDKASSLLFLYEFYLIHTLSEHLYIKVALITLSNESVMVCTS
jgi:hypothetical protein